MVNLVNYVVKTSCKNELGSGFIYLPDSDLERVYIFTTRHCIYGTGNGNGALKTDISITYYSSAETESMVYTLKEEDALITGANNVNEDIAILIVSRSAIPVGCKGDSGPKLINLTGNEKECFVNGVPKVTSNLFPRTLTNCFIEPDKDNPGQIQVSVKNAIVDNFNADELVEGYSGSGCFINNGKGIYVFGLVSRYEEASKRLLGINFSLVNTLLEKNGSTQVKLLTIETNNGLLNDIEKLQENTNRILSRIKTNIGSLHLERTEIENHLKGMIFDSPFTIVTGKAGMGKSAIVKKVLQSISSKFSVIALRGEELDRHSISSILNDIQITTPLETILSSPGLMPIKVLLIESVEKILETSNSETILDFFNLVKERTDVKLIVTGRSYAVEQLKIRFLKNFPVPSLLDIPLSDSELILVEEQYPHIKVLLAKPALKRLLQIPFNLDKAILLKNEAFESNITNEWDLKQIMWDYVIENKEKQPDIKERKKRGETFSQIAFNRAVQMVSFVKADDADLLTIQELEQDNIIEVEEKLKNRYSPTHDIFEDWALTRIIEDKFSDWSSKSSEITNFFSSMGSEPAIRRAFRIWLTEKIYEPNYTLENFLKGALIHKTLDQFWKDEILTAIMQSSYSQELFSKNKELLFEDDFLIFKRCLLLLRVACQEPDLPLIKLLSIEKGQNQITYESYYLKPIGEGWANMINFIHTHIGELRSIYPSIIMILLDWKKGLDADFTLPPEAENVAAILIDYFDNLKIKYKSNSYSRSEEDKLEECVDLILRVCAASEEKVSNILDEAMDDESNYENHHIRDLNQLFLKSALSYLNSKWICHHLPNMVTKIAEKEWFHYPPTPEEIAELQKQSPFYSMSIREDKEESFGVTDHHRHNYMPASGMQTPIKNLLYSNPDIAIDFIIKLFNHSVDAYFKSNFLAKDGYEYKADDRVEVKIEIGGKEFIQKGTSVLWGMYRGGAVATPYLLQSVLMALENWMLGLAEAVQNKNDPFSKAYLKLLERAVDKLLTKSNSVSTTAVIASLATAYPNVLGKKIFPLLKVREFYAWDLTRYASEREGFFFNDPQYLVRERKKSYALPHRRKSIEDLLRQLYTSGFGKEMCEILDFFYAQNPTETLWKIALNRMDLRKLEIVEQTETGFIVQTKIDDDLKDIAIENTKKQDAIMPVTIAANWSRNKYENKPLENDTYTEWQKHFKSNTTHDKSVPGIGIWVHNGLLAAVGLRDFFDQLTQPEKLWCIETIISIIEKEIKKDPYSTGFDDDSQISVFDIDPALETLPSLIFLGSEKEKQKAKTVLFAALLFIDGKPNKDKLLNTVRNVLWEKAPDFALSCIGGMIEYSKISSDRYKIGNWHTHDKKQEKQKQKAIDAYNKKLKEIFDSVSNSSAVIKIDNIHENNHSIWMLIDILSIIPFNTSNSILHNYIDILLQIVLNSRGKERGRLNEENVPFELAQRMEKYYSHFLINQDKKTVIDKTQKLVSWIFDTDYQKHRFKDEKFEFVQSSLDNLNSWVERDMSLNENFWMILEHLYKKSLESGKPYLSKTIMLWSPYWNSNASEWKPMVGKKHFFEKVIKHFNGLSPTAMLISGIGFTELMPEGINWYADILRSDSSDLSARDNISWTEKLVQRAFYDKKTRDSLKENVSLRKSYIFILDELINRNSAVAFLIREDFISLRKNN